MLSTDRVEFVRVLNGLAAIKRCELTSEAIDVWWMAMAQWPIVEFKAAASHLVGACQFMPSPYDFAQLRKAAELTAAEAWTEVLEACAHWRDSARLPNGRAARAARAVGGFKAIAMANTQTDMPHIQRRFLEAYAELSDVESVRDALPQIAAPRGNEFARITDIAPPERDL